MPKSNNNKFQKIPLSFYLSDDVLTLSKQLLGQLLITNINGIQTGGIIVETEAYAGINDRASHSYNNKKTKRNKAMFERGGIAYIYLCYGIHHLFNIVTNDENNPQAVLVRAIEPTIGTSEMLNRRNMNNLSYHLTSGPGKLTQALGLSLDFNQTSLQSDSLCIYKMTKTLSKNSIIESPRVGIDYAGHDALKPWRFRIKDNPWCSK
tara:strand:- start:818 stop:1438 length:621 start_codon:yes stop_codon:yes gene_type:complete